MMKKLSKIISILIALVIVITPIQETVFATESATVVTVDNVYGSPEGTVDVNVTIENNPGILGAILSFTFDEGLTLVNAVAGDALSALVMSKPGQFTSPCQFAWDGESIKAEDIKDGIVLTLTFEISKDATPGESLDVEISYDRGDVIDSDLKPVTLKTVSGKIAVIDYTPGDLNSDKKINAVDIVLLRRYITGGYGVTVNEYAADVNDDGKINTTDVILIRRYIAGGYGVRLEPSHGLHDHIMQAFEYKAASCVENGNIAYWHCTFCNNYYSDADGIEEVSLADTILEKTDEHTVVIDKAVAPTATSTGLTEGSHCSMCNTVFVEQKVIPVLVGYSITYHISNNDSYLAQIAIENNNPNAYTAEEGLVLQDIMVDGYNFKGWYTSQTGGTKVTEISVGSTGNRTLYAQWEKVEYTVTFDSPDVPWEEITYTVDKGATLTNPSWFGYTFVGWSNDDGFIMTSIKRGTTGNITLHANWTSNRNKATSYSSYGAPIIIEDDTTGQFLFVYNIGKIDNVPLSVIEKFTNTDGLHIDKEYEVTDTITSDTANTVANAISNATTKSSGWTLSEEWNDIYSEGSEYSDSKVKTDERTDSEGNVVGGNYFVSNSAGGSSYISTESGGSYAASSKVTTENSKGINTSYDTSSETYVDGKLGVTNTTEASAGASFPVKIVDVSVGVKNTNTISAELAAGRKDNESFHVDTSQSSYVGTVDNNSASAYYNTTANQSSTWNSTTGYEKSYQSSYNTAITSAISEQISKTNKYSLSKSLSGANSKTERIDGTKEEKTEYSTTLKYSEGTAETTTKHITYTSNEKGYYRLVTAGTVHVYGVVGYDVATGSYYTYTFNVLDDERHEYLDYSKDSANFNDCENGVVTFQVPYEVNEYVLGVTGATEGLEYDLDGTVTGFTEPENFDGTVVVPQYYSVYNGDGTYSAFKTKGISATAFRTKIGENEYKGNENIKTVILPVYVTEIPDSAFEGCTNLERVIAFGITKIGKNAFKGCTSLDKFSMDNLITSLGENAFEGVAEIEVMAANAAVADVAVKSGAKRITVNLSCLSDSYDNKQIVVSENTEYFALISNGTVYSNLCVESNADETYISNVVFANNADTPLKLNSAKVTLGRVTVENSPGFALILPAENTELGLFGVISLSSKGENAVISQNVSLSKSNAGVSSSLNVTGNYLVCGEIDNDSMLSFTSGKVIYITDEEFADYLTSSIITFDANGGEVSEVSKIVYYGQLYGTLPTPTKANYTFDGWYTEKDGGTEITSDTTVSALVNQTLYAKWKPNTFTVTFDANGGSVSPESKTLTFGDTYGTLPTPTRNNCTFDGWFTEDGKQITSETIITDSGDITVKAHWTSDWILASALPSDGSVVSNKWSYDLTTNITSSSSSVSGYTLYNTTWVWGSYGSWSGWSNSAVSSSDSRQVETRTIAATYKTQYNYSCYTQYSSGTGKRGPWKRSWADIYCSYYHERGWSDTRLSAYDTQRAQNPNTGQYETFTCYGSNSNAWYNEITRQVEVTAAYNQYRYRDRSKVYTYYHTKTEAKESTTEITASDTISNVKKWVKYVVN